VIEKCPHCPIAGDCLAIGPTCRAIKDDPARMRAFIDAHVAAQQRRIDAILAEVKAEGIPESIEPRGGCCG
jgi:hypothetical protein